MISLYFFYQDIFMYPYKYYNAYILYTIFKHLLMYHYNFKNNNEIINNYTQKCKLYYRGIDCK